MATNTTRLGLTKPDPTELYDVNVFNTNADKIDLTAGTIICTSGTRPTTGRFVGMTIFETDTNDLRYWDGDSWEKLAIGADDIPAPPTIPTRLPNVIGGKWWPGGTAALGSFTTTSVAEVLTGMDTGAVSLQTGRLYRLVAQINFDSSAALTNLEMLWRFRVTNLAGTDLGAWRRIYSSVRASSSPGTIAYQDRVELMFQVGSTANFTFVLTMKRETPGGTSTTFRCLNMANNIPPGMWIEDMGPVGVLTAA